MHISAPAGLMGEYKKSKWALAKPLLHIPTRMRTSSFLSHPVCMDVQLLISQIFSLKSFTFTIIWSILLL